MSQTQPRLHRYFVAFAAGRNFGSTVVEMAAPIATQADISGVERYLAGRIDQHVVLINFVPLPPA